MKDKFVRGFKKLLKDRDIQQKELAALLGLSESVLSKKLKDPFSSFTESQIRIIKFYTDSSVNGVMADISNDKKWKGYICGEYASTGRWETVLTTNNFEQGYESCKQTLGKKRR